MKTSRLLLELLLVETLEPATPERFIKVFMGKKVLTKAQGERLKTAAQVHTGKDIADLLTVKHAPENLRYRQPTRGFPLGYDGPKELLSRAHRKVIGRTVRVLQRIGIAMGGEHKPGRGPNKGTPDHTDAHWGVTSLRFANPKASRRYADRVAELLPHTGSSMEYAREPHGTDKGGDTLYHHDIHVPHEQMPLDVLSRKA